MMEIIHKKGKCACRKIPTDEEEVPFFVCEECQRKIAWCYGDDGDYLCNDCWAEKYEVTE